MTTVGQLRSLRAHPKALPVRQLTPRSTNVVASARSSGSRKKPTSREVVPPLDLGSILILVISNTNIAGASEGCHACALRDAIIAGLREEDINLIVAIGHDQDPVAFTPQPAKAYIERYSPHSLLLPHCDAFVTHAGFSSVMAGLEQGLPLAGDQPSNAPRCSDLGAARVIDPDERTPEAFRAAVREVLGNPRYRENAARLQQEIQLLPGPEFAVHLLEKLVQDGCPIMNGSQSMTRA